MYVVKADTRKIAKNINTYKNCVLKIAAEHKVK